MRRNNKPIKIRRPSATVLPSGPLKDPNLSLEAKGLWAVIYASGRAATIPSDLNQYHASGVDANQLAFIELKGAGYISDRPASYSTKSARKANKRKEKESIKEKESMEVSDWDSLSSSGGFREFSSRIKSEYNKVAKKHGLRHCMSISASRRAKLRTRFKEHSTLKYWIKVFDKLSESKHLHDKSWMNFDYIIRNPENTQKILDGEWDWMSGRDVKQKQDEVEVDPATAALVTAWEQTTGSVSIQSDISNAKKMVEKLNSLWAQLPGDSSDLTATVKKNPRAAIKSRRLLQRRFRSFIGDTYQGFDLPSDMTRKPYARFLAELTKDIGYNFKKIGMTIGEKE